MKQVVNQRGISTANIDDGGGFRNARPLNELERDLQMRLVPTDFSSSLFGKDFFPVGFEVSVCHTLWSQHGPYHANDAIESQSVFTRPTVHSHAVGPVKTRLAHGNIPIKLPARPVIPVEPCVRQDCPHHLDRNAIVSQDGVVELLVGHLAGLHQLAMQRAELQTA